MIEGNRVVAGEAILSGPATTDHNSDDRASPSATEIKDVALELLVRQHSRMVYRIAYAVLRRHHDAEDATQETFLRVLRYNAKLDAIDDPKTWLARIAWRVAIDRSKQHGRRHEIALEGPEKPFVEVPTSDPAADQKFQGAELGSTLEKLIAALPGKLREPLILSTLEEMTPREVAATLGINEAAVRSRVFRARQILKERLAKLEGPKQR